MSDVKLTQDQELSSLLPEPSPQCDIELEADVLKSGGPCDSIKVWPEPKGKKVIIVDGYRRYKICVKHGLPFSTTPLYFPTMAEAKQWRLQQHRQRRNMTQHDEFLLAARLKAMAEEHTTQAELGKEMRVTKHRVYRSLVYQRAFEKLPRDIQQAIATGVLKASGRVVEELASLVEGEQRRLIGEVERGEFSSLYAALFGERPSKKRQPKGHVSYQPATTWFHEANHRLNVFERSVSDLGAARPGSHHSVVRDLIHRMRRVLKAWQDGEYWEIIR